MGAHRRGENVRRTGGPSEISRWLDRGGTTGSIAPADNAPAGAAELPRIHRPCRGGCLFGPRSGGYAHSSLHHRLISKYASGVARHGTAIPGQMRNVPVRSPAFRRNRAAPPEGGTPNKAAPHRRRPLTSPSPPSRFQSTPARDKADGVPRVARARRPRYPMHIVHVLRASGCLWNLV